MLHCHAIIDQCPVVSTGPVSLQCCTERVGIQKKMVSLLVVTRAAKLILPTPFLTAEFKFKSLS